MNGEETEGIGVDSPKEITLFGAIRELNSLSWRLKDIVYGTKPKEPVADKTIVAKDKITDARNRVTDANGRISNVIKKLEGLGK